MFLWFVPRRVLEGPRRVGLESGRGEDDTGLGVKEGPESVMDVEE